MWKCRRAERRGRMKEKDLKALLEDMSLEEKVNQLVQLPGVYFQEDALTTGTMQQPEKMKAVTGGVSLPGLM